MSVQFLSVLGQSKKAPFLIDKVYKYRCGVVKSGGNIQW